MAEGCFLHSPSSSAITEGVDSICCIEVLGAPIPVLDFPCSLVGKEFAMQGTWVRSLGWEEMAAHSSILAWRIPWTEERGGLQSMGSKESDSTE